MKEILPKTTTNTSITLPMLLTPSIILLSGGLYEFYGCFSYIKNILDNLLTTSFSDFFSNFSQYISSQLKMVQTSQNNQNDGNGSIFGNVECVDLIYGELDANGKAGTGNKNEKI